VIGVVGHEQKRGGFLVVAGEILEVIFLREDVGLRFLFPAGVAGENDRPIHLREEFAAALGIDAVRFALAALLCGRFWCGANQDQNTWY